MFTFYDRKGINLTKVYQRCKVYKNRLGEVQIKDWVHYLSFAILLARLVKLKPIPQ